MTLLEYFESAKKYAITANNPEAVDCFTWLAEALNTDDNRDKTVNPDVPAEETAKTFAKAIHELTDECFIFKGVEIGMRSNAPSETTKEAVNLVLEPKIRSSWWSLGEYRYLYHYPFSGEHPESVSDFFRKLVIKVHEIEAEDRRLVKMSKGLRPPKEVEDFGYNPQETLTAIEISDIASKITHRDGVF